MKRPFPFLQSLCAVPMPRCDGDGQHGGEQRAADAAAAHLQVSHHICRGPFPVAEVWDTNLVALGLVKDLLHRKAGAQGSKHAPILFQHPNLGCTQSPWQDKMVPGQRDLARGHDGTIPLLQHKPGGDKIISNRRKRSDYQHPSPVPDLLSLSAASFLRKTAAVSECLREGWAELSLQPVRPR